ncbi:MAG: hypothetical protein WC551_13940 [Patescibacteria group bacterium]
MVFKKKKSKRTKKNKAIPLAIAGPIAMPAIQFSLPKAVSGDFKGAALSLVQEYTGINPDGSWNPKQIAQWAVPTLIGVGVHKAANHPKIGVNKYIRRFTGGMLEL